MNFLNQLIVRFVKILPKSLVYLFAKKYIAGTKLQDAVNAVKDLNSKNIMATMDVLGEAISSKEEAIAAKEECFEVLDAIKDNNLDANLSIKPTQLGLSIDEDFAYENILEVVKKAASFNNFVRIDMEDSPYTDKTIRLYRRIKEEYPKNVGIVVQAYLKRTMDDVTALNQEGGHYRLCKGIYVEPAEIAYKERERVRKNFLDVLEKMLDDGNFVGIATHDDPLVVGAYKFLEEKKVAKDKYEFQMLYGVKENMRDKINTDGHRLRIYVPYGEQWYAYSVRRLQENPQVAWYITKAVLRLD
ncbi:MAG: proline dehydrogenase [Melioribacteraceae bacterium]|nr:MAG: proline dehydrogenase [Melioribacteraceae bacterium]